MKATLSTRAIEILITKCNPLSLHTPKVDGSLFFFEIYISQSLVARSVIQAVHVLSLQTCKYFPWIIFSPNHNSFQLLISAQSSRCLDSSSHTLLWLLDADISAAPVFLIEASLYMGNSTSFGFCLRIIYKYPLAQEAPKTASFTWPMGCLWMHYSWASSNSLVTSLEMFPWNAVSGLNDSPQGWEFTADTFKKTP